MRHLEVEVTNVDELLATEAYGAGALLRWERAPAEAGTWTEGGTEALLAGVTLYDVWDSAGVETTWYRTRISNAGGTSFSAYSDPRSPVESVTSIAEVRALVTTSLSDTDLQAIIDREEEWLAGRIGQLVGERIETFYPERLDEPLYLRRHTDAVTVVEAGVQLAADDFLFTPSMAVTRRSAGSYWRVPVAVTYTPNDAGSVRRVVIELVRMCVSETGLQSETIGAYSYTRGGATDRPEPAWRAASWSSDPPTRCGSGPPRRPRMTRAPNAGKIGGVWGAGSGEPMSFDGLLRHQLVIRRNVQTLSPVHDPPEPGDGEPVFDEYGQPVMAPVTVATVAGRIEPMSAREVNLLLQSGAVVSTHRAFVEASQACSPTPGSRSAGSGMTSWGCPTRPAPAITSSSPCRRCPDGQAADRADDCQPEGARRHEPRGSHGAAAGDGRRAPGRGPADHRRGARAGAARP